MPLKPHPTDPDKMVYVSRQYDMPDTPTARAYLAKVLEDDDTQVYKRKWVGLTAQEAAECWTTSATQTWKNFEAKLKEKNNGT